MPSEPGSVSQSPGTGVQTRLRRGLLPSVLGAGPLGVTRSALGSRQLDLHRGHASRSSSFVRRRKVLHDDLPRGSHQRLQGGRLLLLLRARIMRICHHVTHRSGFFGSMSGVENQTRVVRRCSACPLIVVFPRIHPPLLDGEPKCKTMTSHGHRQPHVIHHDRSHPNLPNASPWTPHQNSWYRA